MKYTNRPPYHKASNLVNTTLFIEFKKLAEATDPGKMGEWTTINDTWRERKADMGRAVYNNPFIKHASMTETQVTLSCFWPSR